MWDDVKLINVAGGPRKEDHGEKGYPTRVAFTTSFTHNRELVVFCTVDVNFHDHETPADIVKLPVCQPITPEDTWEAKHAEEL